MLGNYRDLYAATLALGVNDANAARSVAFPSLSTGAYGFPLQPACRISVAALLGAGTRVERCLLVAFDVRTQRCWERALGSPG